MSFLGDEARYLHAALFKQPLSSEAAERYAAAHDALFPEPEQSSLLKKILACRLDAQSVELALRRKNPANRLTRKMQIVCYLAEVRAEYFPEFINTHQSRARAVRELALATLGSACRLAKGKYLVWRYGLR